MIKRVFSRLKACTSGNALIMVAGGMPVLIGAAGFAVDVSQWYLWKRELQHAVDQAAYAGAWARSDPDSEDNYELRAGQEYDANVAIVEDFDTTPVVQLASFGGGTDNSVVVSSSATRRLPFSSFLTGESATISVRAQATFRQGASYSACIISLTEEGTGTDIGGNAVIRARCGLAALSCDDDAIVIDGSADVLTDSIAACGTISSTDPDHEDIIAEDVRGLVDIYADLEPPTNNTPRNYACTGRGRNAQASLLPGTYRGLVVSCNTVFASGIYVIDGGVLDLTHNSSLVGTGVMFVLRNGATMKLGGQGNSNAINLTPMTTADFAGTPYASQADDLAGILVFEDRENNATQDHIFNGNSNSLIEGLIYLPDGNLRINGTADVASQCLQISAYTINILGGAVLETLCPIEDTTSVGNALADVRLVA
jgi:Putative Flp pilus-assembly TadE/G-like